MSENLKPAIRFKEFTDDWEKRKLGDLLTPRIEHQKISPQEPLLAFSYAEGVIEPEDKKSNKRDFIMTDKYNKIFSRTEVNDIIYNPANVIHGAIHRNSLKAGVVSPIYKIFICNEGVSSKYMGERLHTDKFINEITKYIEGTVIKLRTLSPEKFLDMTIEIPKSITEQQKIGTYFSHLDHLITLQQHKCESLSNVKKAMLEKMFPKNGSVAPEIRFAGFDDVWEKRKFSDLVKTRRGLTYSPADIREQGIRVLRSSNIYEDSFQLKNDDVFVDEKAINIEYAQENDILITAANGSSHLVGKHAIIANIPEKLMVHGGFMLIGTAKNPFFMNASMSSYWYKRFIDLYVSGGNGTIGNLSKSDLDEQEVFVPRDDEQQQIGTFFCNLNHIITLHQRKLEKLKNIKKTCLEKMFV